MVANEECRLLIVDDEPALRRALRTSLTAYGLDVSEAGSGAEALAVLAQAPADLVLLDINMPGMNGIEVCRGVRAQSAQTGIVMVTVCDAESAKVESLKAGADDFITKPYRLKEMIARLNAVLRRHRTENTGAGTVLRAGRLELDPKRGMVLKDGSEIPLSPIEFALLAYLFRHQGAPIAHGKLLQAVWGSDFSEELESLRSCVKTLRKKIEDHPASPEYLLTEPWVGYRFRNPLDRESPSSDE
jgi:two-component system KDP operon response regulator KdpE